MAAEFIALADYLRPRPARPPVSSSGDNVIPLPVRPAVPDDAERSAVMAESQSHGAQLADERVAVAQITGERIAGGPTDAGRSGRGRVTGERIAGEESDCELVAAVREARLFRARLADAFDAASARLLRELAAQVLMRELRIAPCEIDELVARVRERAPVVRVRLSPADAARLRATFREMPHRRTARNADVPVIADDDLSDGDAIVELAGGALDARLGVRLATVLEAFV